MTSVGETQHIFDQRALTQTIKANRTFWEKASTLWNDMVDEASEPWTIFGFSRMTLWVIYPAQLVMIGLLAPSYASLVLHL